MPETDFDSAITALRGVTGDVGGREAKVKKATELLTIAANFAEDQIPGVKVTVTLDGKMIVGKPTDVEEQVKELYKFYTSLPHDKFQMADDVDFFVSICVFHLGDTEAVRKAAKTIFNKKGA